MDSKISYGDRNVRIMLAAALALHALACGDGSGGSEADLTAGLPPETPLSAYSTAQRQRYCDNAEGFISARLNEPDTRHAYCLFGAVVASSFPSFGADEAEQSVADTCMAHYDACMDGADFSLQDAKCDSRIFDACDATAGQLAACQSASYDALGALLAGRGCADAATALGELGAGASMSPETPEACVDVERSCPQARGSLDEANEDGCQMRASLSGGIEYEDEVTGQLCGHSFGSDGTEMSLDFGLQDDPSGLSWVGIFMRPSPGLDGPLPERVGVHFVDGVTGVNWRSDADACSASVSRTDCTDDEGQPGKRFHFTDVDCAAPVSVLEDYDDEPITVSDLELHSWCVPES